MAIAAVAARRWLLRRLLGSPASSVAALQQPCIVHQERCAVCLRRVPRCSAGGPGASGPANHIAAPTITSFIPSWVARANLNLERSLISARLIQKPLFADQAPMQGPVLSALSVCALRSPPLPSHPILCRCLIHTRLKACRNFRRLSKSSDERYHWSLCRATFFVIGSHLGNGQPHAGR